MKKERIIRYIDVDHHLRDVLETSDADDQAQLQGLQLALQQLPARQREVLHLRYFQEIKNQEISEIMGISYQSVCNLLQRAIKQMRVLIQKDL